MSNYCAGAPFACRGIGAGKALRILRATCGDRVLPGPHMSPMDPKRAAEWGEVVYRKWLTWRLPDHSWLRVEIQTDVANHYFGRRAAEGKA